MPSVTFCLTSCNRFNLLEQTLDSFLSLNDYPIEKFIITEDSGSLKMKEKIQSKYGSFEIIFNETNLGLLKSIDNMYSRVSTEYIFHCEDDWRFFNNKNFIKESIEILEERKDVHQVWIREQSSLGDWMENDVVNTSTNVSYKLVKSPHLGGWCGFSFNPGLRRLSDYKLIFPHGLYQFASDKGLAYSELNCNNQAAENKYRAALLMNPACTHIGYHQSTHQKKN